MRLFAVQTALHWMKEDRGYGARHFVSVLLLPKPTMTPTMTHRLSPVGVGVGGSRQ
jgi:hypothetical protein